MTKVNLKTLVNKDIFKYKPSAQHVIYFPKTDRLVFAYKRSPTMLVIKEEHKTHFVQDATLKDVLDHVKTMNNAIYLGKV